ncbi:AAA family ATPase [Agrobacterium rubi]|nr:AAA family ATPase [Agrobacterium rubi]NTF24918.1 AAA family ATPase [Agrobacterium rubi]
MQLTNIGLINWHTYDTIDVPFFGGVTGLIGNNGAGKSTLLDGLHVILTGGQEVKLNKRAAGEKTGEGPEVKRTIHSYCLGRLNLDSTKRDDSNTYLLAGFEDPAGRKPPVTLLLGFHASRDSTKQHLEARAIVKGLIVRTSDLVRRNDKGDLVIDPWNETRTRLEGRIKASGATISYYMASAKEYIQHYMLALFYRGRYDNQTQFIKNLENGIAFKAVGSATDFVQRYVLPDNPIDINALRSSAATFNKLVDQVKLVRSQIAALDGLVDGLESRRNDQVTESREKAIAAMGQAMNSRRVRRKLRLSRTKAEQNLARQSSELARVKLEIVSAENEIAELRERRSRLSDASRMELLQTKVTGLRRELDVATALLLGENGLGRAAHILRYKLPKGAPDSLKDALVTFNGAVSGSGHASVEYIPQDTDAADLAFLAVCDAIQASKPDIERLRVNVSRRTDELSSERQDLSASIANLEGNRSSHDRDTVEFLDEIGRHGISAEVLADLVEIEDESWRDATERLLGSNRDTVFVKPADYDAALALIDANQRKFGRISLANTVKLSRHQPRPRSGMLTDVLRPSNDLAAAFIDRKFGSVQLAETRADFTRDGRWLLRSGLYDDGTSSRALGPATPKIGQKGNLQRLPILKARQNEVAGELVALASEAQDAAIIASTIQRIEAITASLGDSAAPFGTLRGDWKKKGARIEEAEDDIAALKDSSEGDMLDGEIEDASERKAALEISRDELTKAVIGLDRDVKDVNEKLDGGENDLGSRDNVSKVNAVYRRTIEQALSTNRWPYHVQFFVRLAEENEPARIAIVAASASSKATERLRDSLADLKIEAGRSVDLCEARNVLPERMDLMDDVYPWAFSMLHDLRNDRLLEHETMLEQCRRQSDELFKAGFVNELASKFDDVRRQIGDLNAVIKSTRFLGEVYKLKIFPAPGREAFHVVVKNQNEVNTATSGGGLFMNSASPEVQAAMDEIKSTIFTADMTVDLDQFTDYRRYFAFDLEITNEETGVVNTLRSRQGAGSGGEIQTPYYICMMAAMSNIYYGGPYKDLKAGEGGLCLAIFDEAFSNMDDKVTGQAIELGRSLGLQLILCGPSSKKVVLQRNSETLLTVVKSSDARHTRLYPQRIHKAARDDLKAIDPGLRSETEILSMMAERAARA